MSITKQSLNKIAVAKQTETEQAVLNYAELAVKNLLPQLLECAEAGKLRYILKPNQVSELAEFIAPTSTPYFNILRVMGKILGSEPYNFSINLEQTFYQDNPSIIIDAELLISWED